MANANVATAEAAEEPRGLVASAAWRTEDWIAVLIGFVVIAAVLGAFQWKVLDPSKVASSYRWTTDAQLASMTPGWIAKLDAISADAQSQGRRRAQYWPEGRAGEGRSQGDRGRGGKDGEARQPHAARRARRGDPRPCRGRRAARVFTWNNLAPVLYVGHRAC